MSFLTRFFSIKRSRVSNSFADINVDIDKASYVVLDTELTGLDLRDNSIVSIGAIKMSGKRIHTGETFYNLVKPETKLTGETVVIHQITPSELEDKPEIGQVLPEFLEFCGDSIIIGYLPQIDLEFLNRDMLRLHGMPLSNPVIDVLTLYRWIAKREGDTYIADPKSLYEIALSLDIPVKGAHNALGDAFITAQVFQRILHVLMNLGVTSFKELYGVSNPSKVGDALRLSATIGSF